MLAVTLVRTPFPISKGFSIARRMRAEAVAFVVCSAIGFDTGTAAQDYIGLYDGDAKLPAESLQYVQQASSQILNAIGADGGLCAIRDIEKCSPSVLARGTSRAT